MVDSEKEYWMISWLKAVDHKFVVQEVFLFFIFPLICFPSLIDIFWIKNYFQAFLCKFYLFFYPPFFHSNRLHWLSYFFTLPKLHSLKNPHIQYNYLWIFQKQPKMVLKFVSFLTLSLKLYKILNYILMVYYLIILVIIKASF